MSDTKVIVFIESPIMKIFLFECSKYWASEGFTVHYVSCNAQETLPPPLQGTKSEMSTYLKFMQITFFTAPRTVDLIDYLTHLRKAAHVPKILVVEDITSYIQNSVESEYLLMCSLLKNTGHLCSLANDGMAYLLLSSAFEPDILNIINLILLPNKIWRTSEEENNEKKKNYSLRDISLDPTCGVTNELRFSLLKTEDNESLRLNNIKLTFEQGCNFNNCIV